MNEKEIKKWEAKQESLVNTIQDFDECFDWLKNKVVDWQEFGRTEEESAVASSHMGLGMYIRNELGFWKDCNKEPDERTPLVKWFNKRGIYHPDDMSSIILTSWHRDINGKKKKIKKQIKKYREFWSKTSPKVNEGIL